MLDILEIGIIGYFLLGLYMLFVGNLLSMVLTRVSRIFAFLITYALLINFAFIFDYYELSTKAFIAFNLIAVLGLLAFVIYKRRSGAFGFMVRRFLSWKNFVILLLIAASLVMVYLPRVLYLPQNAAITGYKINHDSVNHLAMFRGYEFTRERLTSSGNVYNASYPRGFHSLVHYFTELTGIEYINILTPTAIFAYAMTALAAYWALGRVVRSRYVRFVASLFVLAPFLNLASTYIFFVSHIAVMPFILVAARLLTENDVNESGRPLRFLLITLFVGTILSIYSVLPLATVGLGALAYFVYLSWIKRAVILPWYLKSLFDLSFLQKVFLPLIGLVLLLWPTLLISYNVAFLPANPGKGGSEILQSQGNIPGGYISPYHLSGLWTHQIDYRASTGGTTSGFAYVAIIAIFFQAFLIFRSRQSNLKWAMLTSLGSLLLMLVFIFYFSAVYLQFKQISFVILIWFFLFSAGFNEFLMELISNIRVRPILRNFAIGSIMLAYLVPTYLYASRSIEDLGILSKPELNEIEVITEGYAENSSVMLLSTEDWFQYYMNQADDYGVLTQYMVRKVPKDLVDYLILDDRNAAAIELFLSTRPELRSLIEEREQCGKPVMFHYEVISTACLYEGRTFDGYK